MGYFSNGTEGEMYEARYCERCIHYGDPDDGKGCAILFAHLIHNYDECNNDDSILHLLIPRNAEGDNLQCELFVEAK